MLEIHIQTFSDMTNTNNFDVIIIGGSYSGLSAALALGRSLRHVLIIDSGKPCNEQTPHSHNFLTHDGETPRSIASKAKEEVSKYETVHFHSGLAVRGEKTDSGFEITTEAGESFTAKKLIFATGVRDIMPEIDGISECWGISVIHCPYCHGYEVRGEKTGLELGLTHTEFEQSVDPNLDINVEIEYDTIDPKAKYFKNIHHIYVRKNMKEKTN